MRSAAVVEAAALRRVVVDGGAGKGDVWIIRGGGAARLALAEAVAPGAADVALPGAALRRVDAPVLIVTGLVAVTDDGLEAILVPGRGREVGVDVVEHVITF